MSDLELFTKSMVWGAIALGTGVLSSFVAQSGYVVLGMVAMLIAGVLAIQSFSLLVTGAGIIESLRHT